MSGRKRSALELAGHPGKRQVTKATFDKWQRQQEKEHQTVSWLRCNLDHDNRHATALYCSVCWEHKDNLQSMRSFSTAWITGSSNCKVSNAIDQATSEVHKVVMAQKRVNKIRASGGSAALLSEIRCCLSTLDDVTKAQMEKKFGFALLWQNKAFLLSSIQLCST